MKVICVAGYKNSGKTTLVTRLVGSLSKKGRVGTVKQMVHHRFNPAQTDTGRHFDAGAEVVAAITATELVTIKRNPGIEDALNELTGSGVEFVLVEGGRSSDLPKLFLGMVAEGDEVTNIIVHLPVRSNWDIDHLVRLILDQPDWSP